jgi:hypothetical protein
MAPRTTALGNQLVDFVTVVDFSEDASWAQFSVDYLRRLSEAVDSSAAAFESWMETQEETDHMRLFGSEGGVIVL